MDNNFWSQAAASLAGSFSAFVLSIILFFITQSARQRKGESAAAANAAVELETDIGMLEEISGQIEDLCGEIEIETDLEKLYVPMRYTDILTVFVNKAYQDGLFREVLSSNEITELNRLFSRNAQADDLNLFVLNNYKDGKQGKAEALRFFRGQKKQVERDIKFLDDVKQRLEKLSTRRRKSGVAARFQNNK